MCVRRRCHVVEETLEPSNAAARSSTGRDGGVGDTIKGAIHRLQEADHDLAHGQVDAARGEVEQALEELEGAEHDRDFWIVVNGRRKEVHKRRLTFAEVVRLAFPDAPPSDNIIYTVAYRNGGNDRHPEGTLVVGESVKIKDGTIFDVTATDKS
jgi:Multiubiquitin